MSTVAAPAPAAAADAPDGVIRLYNKDRSILNQIIGQGFMEGMAKANNRVYLHPVTLAAVVALAAIIDYKVGYLPDPDIPGSSMAPVIGFAMVALPVLGIVEWLHRGPFTGRLRGVIGARDLVQAESYYTSPSRFYVFEHKGEVRGELALDARHPTAVVPTVLGAEEGEVSQDKNVLRQRGKKDKKDEGGAAAGLAEIRHLDIDSPVRRKGVATELVATALDHAFGIAGLDGSPAAKAGAITRVVVLTSPFTPGGDKFWTKLGFSPVPASESAGWRVDGPLGLLKQSGHWLAVDAATWTRKRDELAAPKKDD
ncbi:uncharacterized protein LOC62_03G004931 [Vanrija pseudolonga]|uniref:N-acetyltransferase domain-containing protein n=1 Tax=Vanrija pseudolonga TaxID=143232 RepID=A0AAF1BQV4_9TREE|nr:hypothetical protein LOC62_03G004931 [Vanrija pseudolonga]